jgi:hypothetical protein
MTRPEISASFKEIDTITTTNNGQSQRETHELRQETGRVDVATERIIIPTQVSQMVKE